MKELISHGYKLACCSNSIRKTVLTVLSKLGIIEYFDLILSNEDVKNSKPHPEMYWKAMSMMGYLPEETLIVEDSPYGLLAAGRSKAYVMRVGSPKEVTYINVCKHLNAKKMNNIPKWKDDKLNILIPMAGAGSRFEQAGYTFPKPLIDVRNKPMIQVVVDNLNIDANYIYIVQKKHRTKYNLDTLLNLITPNCKIVEIEGITEGAAVTTLLAKDYINNNFPLIITNSDQFIDWNSTEFMYQMNEKDFDGGIVSFPATHPKWSFARTDDINIVLGQGNTSDATANGGGITLEAATNKTFTWIDATDAWTSSEHMNLLTGKSYKINGTAISAALPALTWGEVKDGKSGLTIS
jgi:hypothetical protein